MVAATMRARCAPVAGLGTQQRSFRAPRARTGLGHTNGRAARHYQIVTAAAAADTDIAALNDQFGIPGRVEVVAGLGGLPTVLLKHACGASAEVTLFGACVTSWKQASGDEVLFMRPDALQILAGPDPNDAMQQHGFARNSDWSIAATSADPQPDDQDPEVTLVLRDNDYTRKMWPHAFEVAYSVSLHGELLQADMRVQNTGDKPFEFTAALHSYIEVSDVAEAKVADPLNPTKKKEEREEVTFDGPTDSVYLKARDYVELDVGTGAAVTVTTNKWSDVVVWSPWTAMPDCYRQFVCVESAQFSTPVSLKPGEFWRSQAEWSVMDL
ncbi:putative glucose-6-phosphate 1-epimerase [Chlorella vulgaris]